MLDWSEPKLIITLTLDENGDAIVSEDLGEGSGDGKGGKGDGNDRGVGEGTSLVEDDDGDKIAKKKEKNCS